MSEFTVQALLSNRNSTTGTLKLFTPGCPWYKSHIHSTHCRSKRSHANPTFPAAFRLNKSRFCWWEETEPLSTSSSALSAFHLKDVLKKTVEIINGSSKKSLHLKSTRLQWCHDKIATLWAWLGALVTGRSLQHGNIQNHKWASLPTASDHSISTRFVKTDNNVPWQHNQSHIIASLSYLKFQ